MGFMDKMKKAAESAQAQTSKVGIGASADQMAVDPDDPNSVMLWGK